VFSAARRRCLLPARPDAAQHLRAALILAMVDDALRDGHRLIGMIQPDVFPLIERGQTEAVSRRLRRGASPSSPRPADGR